MAAVREAFWLEGLIPGALKFVCALLPMQLCCSWIFCRSLFYMFVLTSKQLTKQPAKLTLSLREATESQNHRTTESQSSWNYKHL